MVGTVVEVREFRQLAVPQLIQLFLIFTPFVSYGINVKAFLMQ